jgi:uncharacterized membrane protein YdfJ with MMPL/SSD domain
MGDRVLVTRKQHQTEEGGERHWARWTGFALRRPDLSLAAGLILLLTLVVPAVGMRLGMPDARVSDRATAYSTRRFLSQSCDANAGHGVVSAMDAAVR